MEIPEARKVPKAIATSKKRSMPNKEKEAPKPQTSNKSARYSETAAAKEEGKPKKTTQGIDRGRHTPSNQPVSQATGGLIGSAPTACQKVAP